MKKLILTMAPLLLLGCVGDGGGEAYQTGSFGQETGKSSPESGFGGTDNNALYELCMDVCVQEASADYCRDDVCAGFNTAQPPGAGTPAPVNNCAGFEEEDLEALDSLGPQCRSCVCSARADSEGGCFEECSGEQSQPAPNSGQ